jgi:hypothetical protein
MHWLRIIYTVPKHIHYIEVIHKTPVDYTRNPYTQKPKIGDEQWQPAPCSQGSLHHEWWNCSRYLEQWVLRCHPKKEKEMNKLAPVLLQSYFQVSNERYVFKEYSRIRLATKYVHHIHPHTCTSWFDCMNQLYLDPRFDFTIYVLQVCSFMLFPLLWAPHKP